MREHARREVRVECKRGGRELLCKLFGANKSLSMMIQPRFESGFGFYFEKREYSNSCVFKQPASDSHTPTRSILDSYVAETLLAIPLLPSGDRGVFEKHHA